MGAIHTHLSLYVWAIHTPFVRSRPGLEAFLHFSDMQPKLAALDRRNVLVASLLAAASSTVRPIAAHAKLGDPGPSPDDVEEQLINLLQRGAPAGSQLSAPQASQAEALMSALEASGGGSQLLASEGIGSWGPWIGAWDIVYTGQSEFAGGPIGPATATKLNKGQPDIRLRLLSARMFVYGPMDAASDLRGVGRDGGTSTELTYELRQPMADLRREVLLARSGSFTKLPAYAYRVEFARPATRLLLPIPDAASGSEGSAPKPLDADSMGVLNPSGGASLREITYLSEKLWISRSNDDGGLLVLQRTDARAFRPPEERPDLTATCSEAVFVRGKVCRDLPLF